VLLPNEDDEVPELDKAMMAMSKSQLLMPENSFQAMNQLQMFKEMQDLVRIFHILYTNPL